MINPVNVLDPIGYINRSDPNFQYNVAKVSRFWWPSGGTDIPLALQTADQVLKAMPPKAGTRKKVILLVTDGQDKLAKVIPAAETIKQGQNHVITVGMGSMASQRLLQAVSNEHKFAQMVGGTIQAVQNANMVAGQLCGKYTHGVVAKIQQLHNHLPLLNLKMCLIQANS